MTRSELVASRVLSRSATYTPSGEDTGSPKWLFVLGMLVIAGGLFYVGRPACRNPREQYCWRA